MTDLSTNFILCRLHSECLKLNFGRPSLSMIIRLPALWLLEQSMAVGLHDYLWSGGHQVLDEVIRLLDVIWRAQINGQLVSDF